MAKTKWLDALKGIIENMVSMDKLTKNIEVSIEKIAKKAETSVVEVLDKIHKKILGSILEGFVLIGSLTLMIIGLMMILNDYLPTRYLFIIVGALGMVIYLLRNIKISL